MLKKAEIEALGGRLTQFPTHINIVHNDKRVRIEVPQEDVWVVKGMVKDAYGVEIRSNDGTATVEVPMGLGTRQVPLHEPVRFLKTDDIKIRVASLKKKRGGWL